MPIEENGWLAGSLQRLRVDERVETRWDDLNVFESGGAEIARNPVRTALDIRFVLALGADAGNAQKFAQLRQMLVAATINELSKIHKRPSGDMSPFQYGYAKLDANVCGRGVANDPLPPLTYFRAATALRTSKRVPGTGSFSEMPALA